MLLSGSGLARTGYLIVVLLMELDARSSKACQDIMPRDRQEVLFLPY